MHELRFLSTEWLGNVSTKPPSLLFPPLFIFGNEKQPEALKRIYTAYLTYKRTQNAAVLLGDAHPPPVTTYNPHSKKAQICLGDHMRRNSTTVKSKHTHHMKLLASALFCDMVNDDKTIKGLSHTEFELLHPLWNFAQCSSPKQPVRAAGQSVLYVIIVEGIIFQ